MWEDILSEFWVASKTQLIRKVESEGFIGSSFKRIVTYFSPHTALKSTA